MTELVISKIESVTRGWNALKLAIGITLGILLVSCLSACAPQRVRVDNPAACPTLYTYTLTEQVGAYYELHDPAHPTPYSNHMMADYGRNRGQIRNCIGLSDPLAPKK